MSNNTNVVKCRVKLIFCMSNSVKHNNDIVKCNKIFARNVKHSNTHTNIKTNIIWNIVKCW